MTPAVKRSSDQDDRPERRTGARDLSLSAREQASFTEDVKYRYAEIFSCGGWAHASVLAWGIFGGMRLRGDGVALKLGDGCPTLRFSRVRVSVLS